MPLRLALLLMALSAVPATGAHAPSCRLSGEEFDVCASCSEAVPEEAMAVLRPSLGTPEHRLWHMRWHEIRNVIDRELEVSQSTSIAQWRREGFLTGDARAFARAHSFSGELSGEDFLFMHRGMLKMQQRRLAAAGKACLAGWSRLPASISDPAWPAALKPPTEKTTATVEGFWQEKLDWVRRNDAILRSPEYLKAATLARLGHDVEYYVHNVLHLLYSSPEKRCKAPDDASPDCDDLMEAWSAPLNRHFWKIHGYVDGFVGLWLQTHGFREIAEDCGGRSGCYQWRGTWLGKEEMLACHR